ncbi:MAG: hypothetical protein ACREPE_09550 [Lysobacter sp.]
MDQSVFIELIVWEDFLDALSKTRLQDEYDKAIRECDIFVMLFCTKVGQYTEEEFETAFGQFKATTKPFIFTYFKDAEISTGSANKKDLMSLWAFQEKLDALRHFQNCLQKHRPTETPFQSPVGQAGQNRIHRAQVGQRRGAAPHGNIYQATLTGNGAIAQGPGATAVGAGGVNIGRKNTGNINTGTQTRIDTGGGAYVGGDVHAGRDFVGRDQFAQGISPQDLEPLFAPLLAAVAKEAPADKQAAAVRQVEQLKAEVAKGKQADDNKIGTIVEGLIAMVPGAIGAVVSMFATPILGGIAGPVTKFVLGKLKGS